MKSLNGLRTAIALALVVFLGTPAALAQATSPADPAATKTAVAKRVVAQDFDYVLGASDVIHVEALNHPDFNVRATIGADNSIQLPYLGAFQAGNKTVSALRDSILTELRRKGIFSDISLQIDVVQYASRFVTVLGGVGAPGLVPIDRAYHLSEVMARVGGVRDGSSEYVILRSKSGPERRISVQDLATSGDANDPLVTPGDKIFVPTEVFYIKGQVRSPGAYPLTLNMSLAMALARSGGLTESGSSSSIKVTRDNVEVDPRDLSFKLKANDIVDVGSGWF